MIDKTVDWLRVALAPGLDTLSLVRFLRETGGVEGLVRADYALLARVAGDRAARSLSLVDEARVEAAQAWLAETPNAFLLPVTAPDYPKVLIEAGMAPPVIFGRGDRSLLKLDALWVTGMAYPDAEAETNASEFGRALAEKDVCLSTGLMPGVECAVARAAFAAGGRAVVWSATGLDRVYPKGSLGSFREALEHDVLFLSIRAPGDGVDNEALGQRETALAAYSRGILVIADERFGKAVGAARTAVQFGRDVFAVPGSIHAVGSKGPHRLIREGAKLVESVLDLLDEW